VVFTALSLLYGLNNLFIGLVLDPRHHDLGKVSPLTLVLQAAGVKKAADAVNGAVIISICCILLSYPYTQSRIAREMAARGRAPRIFAGLTSWGVPVPALIVTMGASAAVFAISFLSKDAFASAMDLAGAMTLVDWMMVSTGMLRFRMAYYKVEDQLSASVYTAPFWPLGQIALLLSCAVMYLASVVGAFLGKDALRGAMVLIGPLITVILFVGHRICSGVEFLKLDEVGVRLITKERTTENEQAERLRERERRREREREREWERERERGRVEEEGQAPEPPKPVKSEGG
jgi:lysine-specific permease